jgi:pimeloyl-ACP methyl ester carboxylesterase
VRAPETKYARSGDLSIAYQVTGTGPPDIVAVPGFISHVELNWESPFYGEPFERLARMGRLVSFDKRGVGLSDRVLGFGTLEQRMDDIRAVLDAANVERASFVAVSEGGPLAIMFAATYPERVEKLVLYATFARLLVDDDYPIGRTPDDFEAFADSSRFRGEAVMRWRNSCNTSTTTLPRGHFSLASSATPPHRRWPRTCCATTGSST